MNIRQELKGIGQRARAAALELAAAPATARQSAIEGMATRLVSAHDARVIAIQVCQAVVVLVAYPPLGAFLFFYVRQALEQCACFQSLAQYAYLGNAQGLILQQFGCMRCEYELGFFDVVPARSKELQLSWFRF